jgi:hypothetical protein
LSPTGDALRKEARYEEGPINGTINGARDGATDGTLDNATDIAGNGILKAAMDRAGWRGADIKTEGDWDERGMSVVRKNLVSLV